MESTRSDGLYVLFDEDMGESSVAAQACDQSLAMAGGGGGGGGGGGR